MAASGYSQSIDKIFEEEIKEDGQGLSGFIQRMMELALGADKKPVTNVEKIKKSSATDFYWKDRSKPASDISTYSVAFLGSDKIGMVKDEPGNILLPMILKYKSLFGGQVPYHLRLYLGEREWKEAINMKMMDDIIAAKMPTMIFHPYLTPISPTGREFGKLCQSKDMYCYYYSYKDGQFKHISDNTEAFYGKFLAPFLFCTEIPDKVKFTYEPVMAIYYYNLLKDRGRKMSFFEV